MLKHDIRSYLSGLMILQSDTKVEKIYVYLHKYDGAWGVGRGELGGDLVRNRP